VALAAREAAGRVLELMQQFLAQEQLSCSRLVLMTRGAVAAGPWEGVADLAGAAVWGLVRSVQAENTGRLAPADLPPAGSAVGTDVLEVLVAAGEAGETELALRDRTAYGRRLVPAPPTSALAASPSAAGPSPGTRALGQITALEKTIAGDAARRQRPRRPHHTAACPAGRAGTPSARRDRQRRPRNRYPETSSPSSTKNSKNHEPEHGLGRPRKLVPQ
jgi:hypothetical protein